MKTFLTIAFVAFLAITTSAVATNVHPSYTQSTTNSCFSYFRAHRQMNGVGMMWAVSQQGVSRFKIERSYDGFEFVEGTIEVPAHGGAQYRFTDRDAMPGFVSYRIIAIMEDGTTNESQTQTVRIIARK
jgi:hypothetical protein